MPSSNVWTGRVQPLFSPYGSGVPPASGPTSAVLIDGIGLLLLIALLGWILLVAEATGGVADEMIRALVLMTCCYAGARLATRFNDWLAPAIVVLAAVALALVSHDRLLNRPLGNPLGYSNAMGSLYMIAATAAILVASRIGRPVISAAFIAMAVLLALVPWLNNTRTAAVLVCFAPIGWLARSDSAVRRWVVAGGCAVLVTLLATVALAFSLRTVAWADPVERLVDATLSRRRVELWRDALELMVQHPLVGVGPGRYPEVSLVSQLDRDSVWPHNEFLHMGVESGFIGLALSLALAAWLFCRLWLGGQDRGTAIVAIGLGAVGVHATVDYVLHFPAVAAAAAILAGAGPTALARARHRGKPRGRANSFEGSLPHGAGWDFSFLDRGHSEVHDLPGARSSGVRAEIAPMDDRAPCVLPERERPT